MQDILGIVNLTHQREEALSDLTWNRCVGTLPFAANYKLVDFALSNLVNSGITKAAVLSNVQSRELINHVSSGRTWGMERRRRGGLTVLPTVLDFGYMTGDVHKFHSHLDYLESCEEKYVILTSSHVLCTENYLQMRQVHEQRGAEVTLLYKPTDSMQEEVSLDCDVLTLDRKGYVIATEEAGMNRRGIQNVFLGTAMMSRTFLIDLIKKTYDEGIHTVLMNAVLENADQYDVFAHPYYGYTAHIDSAGSYLKHSLDLLKPQVWDQLFGGDHTIYTHAEESSPTHYSQQSIVRNSLIAGDCVIEGSVESSVIFSKVHIERGARVKNCVILEGCTVPPGADLENVILGPNGSITPNVSSYELVQVTMNQVDRGLLV
ncbi:hypothetical protein SY83_19465 [Paenibacillus swuensis]|uniref:Uncharacterized protein n=1 Tax=Paenibacillus swuensis TaxID=1178515 RepID=A0A172TMG8_9BACL|nr:glucose-1-phosphate adenylyltransferase subunit GlgD [Paenibacillus swuensis]ANE48104.1 hypothetical protein SY83_19465 [Paenibacillus swuensis]